MVGGAVTLHGTAGQSLLPFAQEGSPRQGWLAGASGEGHLKGTKDSEPWEGEATRVGVKSFVPDDLFQRGGHHYLGTCPGTCGS